MIFDESKTQTGVQKIMASELHEIRGILIGIRDRSNESLAAVVEESSEKIVNAVARTVRLPLR